jgi:plastocyanin
VEYSFSLEIAMNYACVLEFCCVFSLATLLGCSIPEMKGDAEAKSSGQEKTDVKPITIKIKSLKFDPKTVEIHVGDSVEWGNESRTKHTATSDDEGKSFDTEEIEPGKSSKAIKFEKEGEFKYHCKVHGKSMSGTIVVKPVEKK